MRIRSRFPSSKSVAAVGSYPLDILRGRGQVGWRAAFRICIGRGFKSKLRMLIGTLYGLGFGFFSLQYVPWYISFPQAFLVSFTITILGTIPWRIRLKRRGPISFLRILLTNGSLSLASGYCLFLLSLLIPILVGYGWDGVTRVAGTYAILALLWAYIYPLTGVGLVMEEDAERRGRRLEGRARRMAALVEQSRVVALRAQINPHFFFNALNTIASLIPSRPADAERAVELLAESLRPVLMRDQSMFGTVKSEIQIAKAYAEIERLRLGERLTIDFRVEPETLPLTLPSLSLQPLLENAIRHGASRTRGPHRVEVSVALNDGHLVVGVDNRAETDPPGSSATEVLSPAAILPGHALHNIATRLRALFGPDTAFDARVAPGVAGHVRMSLPSCGPMPIALALDRETRNPGDRPDSEGRP